MARGSMPGVLELRHEAAFLGLQVDRRVAIINGVQLRVREIYALDSLPYKTILI